ncbi:MAG: hypothetical protein HC935_07140 [Pseudanabaena sp. SU_2_4]|nr:hypothetical protein [Pseudanabaena sp. SU_2_4]
MLSSPLLSWGIASAIAAFLAAAINICLVISRPSYFSRHMAGGFAPSPEYCCSERQRAGGKYRQCLG